jgi:hypothetical protein
MSELLKPGREILCKTIIGMGGFAALVLAVVEPIDLGRLPQAAPSLSSYGSSQSSLSRPKAAAAIANDNPECR